jgi:hypothetical protein
VIHSQPSAGPGTARTGRNPYADHMSPSLRACVEQATLALPTEQVMLFAELELTRQAAAQTVKLFSDRREKLASLPATATAEQRQDATMQLCQAGALMAQQMDAVGVMSQRAANIEALAADKFSVHNLHLVVEQICDIARHVFSKLPVDLAKTLTSEFTFAVQNHVKLQADNARRGTNLLPDQTVLDMDATVPEYKGD